MFILISLLFINIYKEKVKLHSSITFDEMVKEIVKEDIRIAMNDKLVDDAGLRRNR